MSDYTTAIDDARRVEGRIIAACRVAVSRAIDVGIKRAQNEHAWSHRTYATRDSFRSAFRYLRRGASGEYGPDGSPGGENAVRLATGTKPHEIAAKNARFLRFESRGETVFRRRVWHPGTQPDPYLERAARAAGEELRAAFEAELSRIFR